LIAVAQRRALLACMCLLVAGAAAADEPIPSLRSVPASLAADARARLAGERSKLSDAFDALNQDVGRFEARCRGVATGTPDDAQCQTDDTTLEGRRSEYISEANAYNSEVLAALNARVDTLAQAIKHDQQAIRNLGAGRNAGEYDDWVGMSADAEKERDEQCKEALREAGKEVLEAAFKNALEHGLDKIGSFNPPKANALITRMRNAGFHSPFIEAQLRKVAYTAGKPEMREDAKALIEMLEKSKDAWDLDDLTDASDSKKWEAGASVLGLFVEDKRLELIGKLTLQEVRASFYSVNNNIVRRLAMSEVDDLTRLNEMQLQNLKILSAKLTSDVKLLRQARSDLADEQ
jgi:hypothetical protein